MGAEQGYLQSMSMAVECARWDWLSPSVVASKTKSCSSNRFNVASSTAGLVFEVQQNYGGQKGYMSLACQASSGGSRRDYEKILARKKNRRVREYFVALSTSFYSQQEIIMECIHIRLFFSFVRIFS